MFGGVQTQKLNSDIGAVFQNGSKASAESDSQLALQDVQNMQILKGAHPANKLSKKHSIYGHLTAS